MSIKKNSTSSVRVKINTLLFVIAAVVFSVASYYGASLFKDGTIEITHVPGVCWDDVGKGDDKSTENEYICLPKVGEDGKNIAVSSDNEYALFLYDQSQFSRAMETEHAQTIVMFVGNIFAVASLFGAVIYWNHNR